MEDLSDENITQFKKLICALNNTKGGYCLFGINERKTRLVYNFLVISNQKGSINSYL